MDSDGLALNVVSFIGEISFEQRKKIIAFAKKTNSSVEEVFNRAHLMIGDQSFKPFAVAEYEFELQPGISTEKGRNALTSSYRKMKKDL